MFTVPENNTSVNLSFPSLSPSSSYFSRTSNQPPTVPPQMVVEGGGDSGVVGVVMEEEVLLKCRFMVRPLTKVVWYRGQRPADRAAVHTTNDEVSETATGGGKV